MKVGILNIPLMYRFTVDRKYENRYPKNVFMYHFTGDKKYDTRYSKQYSDTPFYRC